MAVYSGSLVAYLAVTIVNLPFNNLEEMVAQTAYKWAIVQGTIVNTVLELSKILSENLKPNFCHQSYLLSSGLILKENIFANSNSICILSKN